jgi:hypothetical protein
LADPQPAPDALPPWVQALRWDWPWQAHLAPYAQAVSSGLAQRLSVAEVANQIAQRLPADARPSVRFAGQASLPAGRAYEAFIFEQRICPTRDNLHDLFNALTWLALPRTKACLNALQAEQIGRHGVSARRGAVRDALTLLDENGAVLWAPEPLQQALKARRWRDLFIGLRPLWSKCHLLVFGHALQEKLQQPRKAITAHVYLPRCELSHTHLDAVLADEIATAPWAEKPYWPLPLLGVPGWYLPNENFSFYDDARVFRPAAEAGVGQAP